ncbi:MAG TPA: hypothetical protein VEL51_06440 [Vicinamibacterales bacterium]|nr:hypothetical protein [Vicinamibacterales bacterium]
MIRAISLLLAAVMLGGLQPAQSGNPVIEGWYADPEAHVFQNKYWLYPPAGSVSRDGRRTSFGPARRWIRQMVHRLSPPPAR